MLANRVLLEVVRYSEVRDVLESRKVCGKWRDICGKDEVWMILGEGFNEGVRPGEAPRHWFIRCYRSKTTLVSLFPTQIRMFECLSFTLRDVHLTSSLVTSEATYCLFADDGSLIITGGGPLCRASSAVLQLTLGEPIQFLAGLIEARRNHGAVLFQGCIYLFGGMGTNLMPLASAEKLDIKSRSVEALPTSSCSRFCFTPICHSETIYLSGGWSDTLIELFHPLSSDYSVPNLDISPSPERSISVLKGDYLVIVYAEGACWVDLKRLRGFWKPGSGLPPGEVVMTPLLWESTVWVLLEGQPVAIILD
jgi:hypothetical protein